MVNLYGAMSGTLGNVGLHFLWFNAAELATLSSLAGDN
jgi:hypothetical protein